MRSMRPSPRPADVLRAWAAGIKPDQVMATKEWVERHLRVTDGPRAGQAIDLDLTPYAQGIFDALDDESVNEVWVRKSAQVGFTQIGIGWIAAQIDLAPAQDMLVQPTLETARDFNRRKLQPAIQGCAPLRTKVRRQISRSSEGSTAMVKQYPGGSLTLTGANSAADLRSKTIKRTLRDEIDEYPEDLDGQGDPMQMMDARQMAFRATGDWKKLCGSTPTIKGASKVDNGFLSGDQRFWHVKCPHCQSEQVLEFGDESSRHGLKFNREWPHDAHYVCMFNGCVIHEHEKARMVRGGRWAATVNEPGRYPSFHIDTLISQFVTWNDIAAQFLASKDDPQKLKGFVNNWLGQSWEERGEAPDWEKLMLRREDYASRALPPGALVITGGADVQLDGIYYEVVGWGSDKQCWSIDVGFLPGDTSNVKNKVWADLAALVERRYADSFGGQWNIDAFGVDSGFHTNVVYDFCRMRPRLYATKGDDGWHKPSISSSPREQQVSVDGKRRGVKLWHIGTWPLKAELYANLRKPGQMDGEEATPPGYCHFTAQMHDEVYFRQLTAEYLKQETRAGRIVHRWVETGANHWLDCRIIGRAMAAIMGVESMTDAQWQQVIAARGPKDSEQTDIFAPKLVAGAQNPAPARQRPRMGRFVRSK